MMKWITIDLQKINRAFRRGRFTNPPLHIYKILMTVGVIGLLTSALYAQEDVVISAENVGRLQSAQRIDYADLDADIEIGWFAHDNINRRFTILNKDNDLIILDENGNLLDEIGLGRLLDDELIVFIDGRFKNGLLTYVYREGSFYHIIYTTLDDIDKNSRWFVFESDNQPQAIWINCEDELLINCRVFLEVLDADDKPFVLRLASLDFDEFTPYNTLSVVVEGIFDKLPYTPINDESAFVRVGRISLPYVVTSSIEGLIKLWNLETGDVEYSTTVENGPAVFGNINASATHFSWRDPNSSYINLLDFETGENKVIEDLNGAYAQYYLLSHDASLIIAVNVDFVPNVIVWDVKTGTRYDLGAYRECKRIPDKVELSADGTTLIIGCDTGLDLWRIVDEMETE